MKECDYPAYFNTETNTCDFDFENVDCGNRARHIDACKYLLIHFRSFWIVRSCVTKSHVLAH